MKLNYIFPRQRRVREIPVDAVSPNRAQPRRVFEPAALKSLAASIEANGLLTPVSVRQVSDGFELIAGERRLMAFRLLGRETIPAIVEEVDDEKSAVLALIENLQRRDLDFLEEALAIEKLLSAYPSQKELAAQLGLSASAVANKLRVLRLPTPILEQLAAAGLGERHARALLPLCDDARLQPVVERVVSSQMTVAKVEKLVEQLTAERKKKSGRLLILKDLRIFTNTIERAVDVMKEAGINALTTKDESDLDITYTIVIPKSREARGDMPKKRLGTG